MGVKSVVAFVEFLLQHCAVIAGSVDLGMKLAIGAKCDSLFYRHEAVFAVRVKGARIRTKGRNGTPVVKIAIATYVPHI